MSSLHPTRESWLLALIEELRPLYAGELPAVVRISIGFTSKGLRSTRIGETWSMKSQEKCPQVFIHPKLTDPMEVAAIVAHELIHAARPGVKHGAKFKELAQAIGLEGKMVSTVAGEGFKAAVAPMLERLGEFPHEAPMADTSSASPKQTTRMLKMECAECGYLVRGAKKWVELGVPDCPVCRIEMVLEVPEEEAA